MYSTVALQLYLVLKYGTQVRVLGSAMFGTGTRINKRRSLFKGK